MKYTIIMPDLGQTTSEVKIVSWLKNPGEKLAMGEPLLEVETDKATMEVETYVGGYLRKTLANPGDMVAASNPVAVLTDTPDEDYDDELKAKSSDNAPTKVLENTFAASPVRSSGRIAAALQLGPPSSLASIYRLFQDPTPGLISKADVDVLLLRSQAPARGHFCFSQTERCRPGDSHFKQQIHHPPFLCDCRSGCCRR
jgi:pyruvate/2-oxoglutarate dehydrogenase complex dihydrolipoamide acyltransferase (E2) component